MFLKPAARGLAWRCAWLALVAVPAHAGWQDMPDSLALQAMGDSLRVNGTPMQVRAFVSDQPPEALLRAVQENWSRQRGGAEVKRSDTSAWTVLNQAVGDQHRSFQLRQSGPGEVEGFVALTSPGQARAPVLAVRLGAGVTPVSIIDSVDQGRASQQVIAVSSRSPATTARVLEAALRADGWQRHVMKQSGNTVVFAANKGARQFDATLVAEKAGCLVMMNTLDN